MVLAFTWARMKYIYSNLPIKQSLMRLKDAKVISISLETYRNYLCKNLFSYLPS